MNPTNRFRHLLDQYISGDMSVDEREEFFRLVAANEQDGLLSESIYTDLRNQGLARGPRLAPHISQDIIRNIFNSEKNPSALLPLRKRAIPAWRWVAAAALVALAA